MSLVSNRRSAARGTTSVFTPVAPRTAPPDRRRCPLPDRLNGAPRSNMRCGMTQVREQQDGMRWALRIATIVMGAGFTLQGVAWLVAPGRAAASLGMPVLDGLARSTQFGDFAAFFLTLGMSILAGIRPGQARVLYFPAGLLGSAALCRSVAWAVHGAAFATTFISVEIVGCFLLLAAARRVETA